MGKIWEEVSSKFVSLLIGMGIGAVVLFGGVAALSPSEKAATSDVFTVTTPEETTAPAAPTTEAAPTTDAPPPVAEPAPDVTDPAPAPKMIPAPQVNPDGSLPEGWLPPSTPDGPPTAPPAPAYAPPCMPGEGGDRCAPVG